MDGHYIKRQGRESLDTSTKSPFLLPVLIVFNERYPVLGVEIWIVSVFVSRITTPVETLVWAFARGISYMSCSCKGTHVCLE